MKVRLYSDRVAVVGKRWQIRYVRGKHWNKTKLHYRVTLLPTFEVEKDYDYIYIRFKWLLFVYTIEYIKY